jgi:hypothetical protein
MARPVNQFGPGRATTYRGSHEGQYLDHRRRASYLLAGRRCLTFFPATGDRERFAGAPCNA